MAFLLTDQPATEQDINNNGEPWPFALVVGDSTLLADDAGDIVAYLIEGYEEIAQDENGDEQALVRRAEEAVKVAATVQGIMAADAVNEGNFDPDTADEDTLTALFGDRTVPLYGIEHWEHEIPLVLVTVDYEPFSAEPAPSGNVVWVDPSTEVAYLQSLANLGIINFYVHGDH